MVSGREKLSPGENLYYLINDRVLEIHTDQMMQPLETERFEALSLDYLVQLGKEMFAEDPMVHRNNPERARRLCYLVHLKLPRVNALSFFLPYEKCPAAAVIFEYKSIHTQVIDMLHTQQILGQLDINKVDQAVWGRMAA